LYRGPYAKGVVPWGRENGKCAWDIDWCVLLWGSEVCSVQRLKWQQLVRMCARKVQWVSSYSSDWELFVGLQSLKFGVLVAAVRCSDGAATGCSIVDTLGLNRGGNMETWKLLSLFFCVSKLCCGCVMWWFRGMYCLCLQGNYVGHVWNVRCTAAVGVVVTLTSLICPLHIWS